MLADKTAPSAPNVLAQTDDDSTGYRFPVCVADGASAVDVDLSVRFKPVSGSGDQAAGLVWRYRDADNYYIVRANALENNVVLYKVESGRRTDLPLKGEGRTYGKKATVPSGAWSTLAVHVKGSLFEVVLNGTKLYDVEDSTFAGPGRIGVWTKADSVTYFDDLKVSVVGSATLASARAPPTGRSGAAPPATGAPLASRASFPEKLTVAWKVAVGEGHASPIVGSDRVYVLAREGEDEVVQSLELATGKRLWRQSYPAPYTMSSAATAHGKGPKATPTVAEGRVFTFGISGILSCFEAATGRLAWRKEFSSQFAATAPLYGVAQSPVVDGRQVIVHVGGPGQGALTAFDAATGAVRWAWTGDGPAYASPVVAEIAGVRQVVTFSESFLVGVSADRGQLLWKIPFKTAWVQNAVTPIVDGDTVIYSGLDHPVSAVRILRSGADWTTEPRWENADVAAYMSTPVVEGGRIYGLSTASAVSSSAWTRPRGGSSGSRTDGRARTRRWSREAGTSSPSPRMRSCSSFRRKGTLSRPRAAITSPRARLGRIRW